MNIERRIKKHIHGKQQSFFVVTPPGFESITEAELNQFGFSGAVERGGITISAKLKEIYKLAIHLRTATKILWRLGDFTAIYPNQITSKVSEILWELHFKPGTTITLHSSTKGSKLYHTGLIEEAFWKGITQNKALDLKQGKDGINIHLRMEHNRLQISLDCTAPLLYKRGYKIESVPAPIRETIAAALLLKFWDQQLPLIDPMCGSGTLSFEGYLLKNKIPPGLNRHFTFMNLLHFNQNTFNYLVKEGSTNLNAAVTPHFTGDISEQAVNAVKINQKELNIELKPVVSDFFKENPELDTGFIMINPPYNKRLEYTKDAYRKLMETFKRRYVGFSALILHPEERVLPGGLIADEQFRFQNGGINIIASFFNKIPEKVNKKTDSSSEE